jgi:Ca-activated chloride channel family protein
MITGGLLFLLILAQGLSQPVESLSALKVEVRMVEIYAAVMDGKKFVPGLQQSQFQVLENGRPQKIAAFEAQNTPLTMALLMDTTGSMQKALPFVKNAVMQLLTNLRPEDRIGLFSFTDQLQVLQPFGKEKSLAVKALLAAKAQGTTALFDALTQLSAEVLKVKGKKAILVFTDGDDNSSTLSESAAITNLRRTGVPVYSVALGNALKDKRLMKSLAEITISTGGLTFEVHHTDELEKVFAEIGADLQHLYYLGYYPENNIKKTSWQPITVHLAKPLHYKVRAKEGYKP